MSIPYQALVDCMVTFYREQVQRLEQIVDRLVEESKQMREETRHLENQYGRLEDFALEQEERANFLAAVIDNLIDVSSTSVRQDLREQINIVGRDLGIDNDILDDIMNMSDTESELLFEMHDLTEE